MGKRWLVMAVIGVLAGCGDDSNPTQAFCTSFGNGATFASTCTNCAFDRTAARDGDLASAASIVPNASATTETTTLRATSANDIAGGTVVGVWVTQPSFSGFNTGNSFETFLDGSSQEVLTADNGVVLGADEGTPAQGFIGMQTTEAFDEVLFTSTNSWPSGNAPVYYVYEICSDGGAG
jgi:hypothetical protein